MRPNSSTTACICLHFVACGILSAVFLTSCSSGESKNEESEDSTAVATQVVDTPFDTLVAFCNWTELGLRTTAGEKGKYVTTIYLGEQLTLLGDTTSEISQGKRIHYHKVKLVDGKEGWVRDDFIAIDAVPGVFLNDASSYLRPEASTVSDKGYKAIDVVAVKPSKEGWADVNGKPAGKTWFQQGYVHLSDISFQKIDISLAVLYRRAIETKDPTMAQTRLNNLQTEEFKKSRLYALIFPSDDEEEGAPETTMYGFSGSTDDLVNHGASFTNDVDGAANSALSFNGSSYLSKASVRDRDGVSYFFWMRADKSQPGAIPFIFGNACNSGYALLLEDNGGGGMRLSVLCGGVTTNATDSDYTFPVGEWVHVGLVKAGTTFSIFVNGKLSTSGTANYNPPAGELTVGAAPGCNPPGYGAFFSGSIDDFFVAHYAMMEEEAMTVLNGGFK